MLKLLTDAFMEHTTRMRRMVAIAATAFAMGGAGEASAEVIFDNTTGTSSSGGYVVGEYSPGSVYALGGNFTVPVGAPLHLVGGSTATTVLVTRPRAAVLLLISAFRDRPMKIALIGLTP